MKIAWSGRHTPYAHMFFTAFPEIDFVVDEWHEGFRPLPVNATIGPMKGEFDVCITDQYDLSTTQNVKANRTVFLAHCEYGMELGVAEALLEKVDAYVCVSEHKLWTHRELAFHPKMHWIGFWFDGEMWPSTRREVPPSSGFVHNMLRGEQVDIANKIFDGLNGTAIGYANELFDGRLLSPRSHEELALMAGNLSVAINIVHGDSCGMSPLELMAMGVPVIFGLSADLPRFLFSGFNCLITNGRIGDSIPEARMLIEQLLRDPGRREYIGKNARWSVLQEMGVQAFRDKWIRVIDPKWYDSIKTPRNLWEPKPLLSDPSQDNHLP